MLYICLAVKHMCMSPGKLRGPRAVKDKYSALHLVTRHDFSTPLTLKQSKDLNRMNKAVSSETLSPLPYRRAEFAFLNLMSCWHVVTTMISDLLRNCWLFHSFSLLLVTLRPSFVLVLHSPNVTCCMSSHPLEMPSLTEGTSPPTSNTRSAYKERGSWWRVLHC